MLLAEMHQCALDKEHILQAYFFAGTYGSGVPGLITGSLANDS